MTRDNVALRIRVLKIDPDWQHVAPPGRVLNQVGAMSGQRRCASDGDIDQDDLRRHPHPHRQKRASEPARNDQMPILFHDMPVGETIAEARGYHRRIAK